MDVGAVVSMLTGLGLIAAGIGLLIVARLMWLMQDRIDALEAEVAEMRAYLVMD